MAISVGAAAAPCAPTACDAEGLGFTFFELGFRVWGSPIGCDAVAPGAYHDTYTYYMRAYDHTVYTHHMPKCTALLASCGRVC